MIDPVFKGLGEDHEKKGNCCTLGWERFSSLKEQDFDILGFILLDHGMIPINWQEWRTKRVWSNLSSYCHQGWLKSLFVYRIQLCCSCDGVVLISGNHGLGILGIKKTH